MNYAKTDNLNLFKQTYLLQKQMKKGKEHSCDIVEIQTVEDTYRGRVMPNAGTNKIILKLNSGYNVGIHKENIKKMIELIDTRAFMDSFKGVFMEKKYDIDAKEIKKLQKLLA